MYPIIGYTWLTMTMFECFGEPIVTITRADLLREGQLVDVSATAKEAGFRFPVALTREAWLDCVEWSEADSDQQVLQDQSGRLWDVLWMAGLSARRNRGNASRVEFEIWRVPRDGRASQPRATTLVLEVGPGDAGEGVLTIMLPGQD